MKNTAYPSSCQPAQVATSSPARHAPKIASIPQTPGWTTPAGHSPQRARNETGRRFMATALARSRSR
jgi:hypothetical protein